MRPSSTSCAVAPPIGFRNESGEISLAHAETLSPSMRADTPSFVTWIHARFRRLNHWSTLIDGTAVAIAMM